MVIVDIVRNEIRYPIDPDLKVYFNIFFAGSESVVKIPFSVKKGYFFYRAKVYVNYHKQHFTFYRNSYTINGIPRFSESVI